MKWIAIAGSWRDTNLDIEKKVREEVRSLITIGNGIVSGGALGVDYIATDEALHSGVEVSRLKIIIPTSLETYHNHYLNRTREGIITNKQVETLIMQLETVKLMGCLVEGSAQIVNKESYFNRITKIINIADGLIAFHVNDTEGTQDTINKAVNKGIEIKVFTYKI